MRALPLKPLKLNEEQDQIIHNNIRTCTRQNCKNKEFRKILMNVSEIKKFTKPNHNTEREREHLP